MYPEDIARLFPRVPVGTPLRIINEPYLAGWRDGQLYLEAHAPLSEDTRHQNGSLEHLGQVLANRTSGKPAAVDRERTERIARQARGMPVPVTSQGTDLELQLALAPRVSSTPPWVSGDYDIEELRQLPTYY
jgi:L,D-transpeptidase ErfK/SrfK